jgi:hypothetical protein
VATSEKSHFLSRIYQRKSFLKTKRFDYDKLLEKYEQLDSTTQVLDTQERIIAFDPKNDNAYNMLGYFYATRSTKTLEEYTAVSRADTRTEKSQRATAISLTVQKQNV